MVTVLLCLQLSSLPAHADEKGLTIFSITQQDLNGDSRVDLTVIDSAFATDHDRIYVYDQGGDMRPSSDWHEATDFINDVWAYHIGAKDTAQLIVVYGVENGHSVAYVYDDQDGDGMVSFDLAGAQVTVTESPYWTVRITSGSQWFLPDGRVNLNVRMELDGSVWTLNDPQRRLSYPQTLDRMPVAYASKSLKHDGAVDIELEEVADADGFATYLLKRLLTPSPADWTFQRAGLMGNEGRYPTGPRQNTFFQFLPIPTLTSDPRVLALRYFDLPPYVGVDWNQGKVLGIWTDGYPTGKGYHFDDDLYLLKGQANDVDMESPQAYYDLANDHDAFPDMHIWFFNRPPSAAAIWSPRGVGDIPWEAVNYCWNLFNPGSMRWDFKVGLVGTNPITSVVQFPDFGVRTIPYEELPSWINGREWKMRTFVAREGQGYESSEGIYDWQPIHGENFVAPDNPSQQALEDTLRYILGRSNAPPDDLFENIQNGFRAERDFGGSEKVRLYFSPIDRKLHLLGTTFGIWNIDGRFSVNYGNVGGGRYVDRWQYLELGGLRRELDAAGDYLIYTGEDTVVLKQVRLEPSLFETSPPGNRDEWFTLRERLRINQGSFQPGDFRSMLEQFDGPEIGITGAWLRDYRPVGENGFRLVLTLRPGFSVDGPMSFNVEGFEPGDYVLAYNGQLSLQPLTPPQLSASLSDAILTQLELGALPMDLRNDGLEDFSEATLELWASQSGAEATMVVTQTISVLGQSSINPTLQWAPPAAGSWTVTPKVRQSDGETLTFVSTAVTVLPATFADPEVTIAASTSAKTLPFVILGLVGVAAMASLVFWWQWRAV